MSREGLERSPEAFGRAPVLVSLDEPPPEPVDPGSSVVDPAAPLATLTAIP